VNISRAQFYAVPLLLLLTAFSSAAGETRPVRPPLAFEMNRGQVNAEVRFLTRTQQGTIFLTNHDIVFTEGGAEAKPALRMHFVRGAEVEPTPETPTGGFVNYYLSKDPRNWLSHVPVFRKIRYRGVFPGTDVIFHGDGQNLEYDFEVKPYSSPDQIAFAFERADRIIASNDGGLEVLRGESSWHLVAPEAYQRIGQTRRQVDASYIVSTENVITLRVGSFDQSSPLIIDPVVQYANILSVNNEVNITGIQVDASGNLFIGGDTFGSDYPVKNGQGPKIPGDQQVYVTKLNPAGDTILFSSFLPASGFSNSRSLALDAQGNAYIAGISGGADFPLTSTNLGVCVQACNAGFVAKFDASGSLVYSTLLGAGQILPYSLTVDANGNALVAGGAFDNSLKTVNAFQSGYLGGPFFAKLNSTGTDFIFSSYFGGPGGAGGPSVAKGIALDAIGNVFIAGIATSDPPLVQPWQYGDGDLFLAEFAPDGKTLLFSTRLGGSGDIQPRFDTLTGMAIGPDGVIYLIGDSEIPDFPFSLNSFSLPPAPFGRYTFSGMYVLAVNPSLTGLKYSVYLGSGGANALALDYRNHLHIAGGQSFVPPSPLSPQNAVVSDLSSGGFALELDPAGTPVTMTQFGGHFDPQIPAALAVDSELNVYLAGGIFVHNVYGLTQADPVTVGPQFGLDTGYNYNSFFTKISPNSAPQISVSLKPPALILRNAGSADLHISSIRFGGGLAKQWGNCGTMVPSGTSCVLTVSDANGNLASGTITINSDANPPSQTFNVNLPIGYKPGTPIDDIVWFQDVAFSYPPQLQGTSTGNLPLTIWNVGTSNALINSINATGIASETNDCGTILPGADCTIQLAVTPTGSSTQGSLQISYDKNTIGQQYNFLYVASSPQPILLSTNSVSFATQQINGVAIPRAINITNTSNSSITAPNASLQGDPAFTISGNTCAAPLASHQSCAVAVQLSAKSAGTFNGMLTISGQGGSSQVTLFGITQNNTLVQTSPAGLDFGPVAMGGSQTLSLTLTNSGVSPYAISGINFMPPDYTETDNCQGQISVGGNCALSVKFSPRQLGLRRGAVSIGVSISSVAQLTNVSGLGAIPLLISPASMDFGSNILVGTGPSTQSLTLQNQFPAAQAYSLTATGEYSITNTCGNPLPASSTCNASVAFQPTSAGSQSGTLTVSYPNTSITSVVTLSGAATLVPFTLQAASGQTLSATVHGGDTAKYQLQIQAATGFAGTVQLSCSPAPHNAACSIPASITLASGTTSSVPVSVFTGTTLGVRQSWTIYPLFSSILFFSVLGMTSRSLRTCLILAGFVCLLTIGCGSGGPLPGSLQNTTPPGTYSLTVTATNGSVSQPVTLTLTVN
jgi:hypothetical protein